MLILGCSAKKEMCKNFDLNAKVSFFNLKEKYSEWQFKKKKKIL